MSFLMILLALSGYYMPIQVENYPVDEGPVYLAYIENADGFQVYLSMSPDSAAEAITSTAPFPGMLNPAKTYADFEGETRILSVYSQYPFSANYYLATYELGDEGQLTLIEAEGHDYYMEALERMRVCSRAGDFEGMLDEGWSVMYPGGNYYGGEMCILLLEGALLQTDLLVDSGVPLETAMECLTDANSLARNLTNDQLHLSILSPDDYPDDVEMSFEEYLEMLLNYAGLLEDSGQIELAEDVRRVIAALD